MIANLAGRSYPPVCGLPRLGYRGSGGSKALVLALNGPRVDAGCQNFEGTHVENFLFTLQQAEPFTLKELEKLLPKAKGIIWQSVKPCIETLVADGVVQSDKIGINVFYWAFPSAQGRELQRRLDQVQTKVAGLKRRRSELEDGLKAAKRGKVDSKERQGKLAQLNELVTKCNGLNHVKTECCALPCSGWVSCVRGLLVLAIWRLRPRRFCLCARCRRGSRCWWWWRWWWCRRSAVFDHNTQRRCK